MTKEQDFKARFAAVLQDMQQNGVKDAETIWLLGTLAADLAGNLKASTWSGAKVNLTKTSYDGLLKLFEQQGNDHHAAGRSKHAYAIQALAISLVATTQRADPQMPAGENLLDAIIDSAIETSRKEARRAN